MNHRTTGLLVLSLAVAFALAGCDANSIGNNLEKLNHNLFFKPELDTSENSKYTVANNAIDSIVSLTKPAEGETEAQVITIHENVENATGIINNLLNDGTIPTLQEVSDAFTTLLTGIDTATGNNLETIRESLSAEINTTEIETLRTKLDSTTVTVDGTVKSQMFLTSNKLKNANNVVSIIKDAVKDANLTVKDSVLESIQTPLTNMATALDKFKVIETQEGSGLYVTSVSSLVASTVVNSMVSDVFSVLQGTKEDTSISTIVTTMDQKLEGSLLLLDRLTDSSAFTSLYGQLVNIATQVAKEAN